MKQKDVLTKNNDFLNVMFRGTRHPAFPSFSNVVLKICIPNQRFYYQTQLYSVFRFQLILRFLLKNFKVKNINLIAM